jgi:hypothetical protein
MVLEPPANYLKRGYDNVLNTGEQATDYPVAFGTFGWPVQRSLAVPTVESHCEVG